MKDFYNHIDVDKKENKPIVDTINWLRKIIVVFPDSSYDFITSFLSDDENKDLRRSLQEFDTGVEAVQVIKKNIDTERTIPQKIIARIKHDFIDSGAASLENTRKAVFRSSKDLLEIEMNDGEAFTNTLGFNHGNDNYLYVVSEFNPDGGKICTTNHDTRYMETSYEITPAKWANLISLYE